MKLFLHKSIHSPFKAIQARSYHNILWEKFHKLIMYRFNWSSCVKSKFKEKKAHKSEEHTFQNCAKTMYWDREGMK